MLMAAGQPLVVAMYCKHSFGQQNVVYVLPGEASEPKDVESDNSLTLLASCTSFIVASLVSAQPMSRSLAISTHFLGWQMMLQWVQQLLPCEWAGHGLSLASVLMRALCFWQMCSVTLVVDSSLVKAQHILSMFSFSRLSLVLMLPCGYFLDLCFTSQSGSLLM